MLINAGSKGGGGGDRRKAEASITVIDTRSSEQPHTSPRGEEEKMEEEKMEEEEDKWFSEKSNRKSPPALPPPPVFSPSKERSPQAGAGSEASRQSPVPIANTTQTEQSDDECLASGDDELDDEGADKVEEKDTLAPLGANTSSQSRGRRFLNTMKQSLRIGSRQRREVTVSNQNSVSRSPKGFRRAVTTREGQNLQSRPILEHHHSVYDKKVYPGGFSIHLRTCVVHMIIVITLTAWQHQFHWQ